MNPAILQAIYFYFCAGLCVVGALSTVLAQNPIRGALGLLLTIGGIAALFLSLHAEFLAAVQLMVYAGAVVVLFMFVIMLIGPAAQPPKDRKGLAARVLAGIGMLAISAGGIGAILVNSHHREFPAVKGGEGSIEAVAGELFGPGLVPFELSSALLMVAVVGAVAVARGKHLDPTKSKLPSASLSPSNERERAPTSARSRSSQRSDSQAA